MIALEANARNNAAQQALRLNGWQSTRDALWQVLEPLLQAGASVALVGGGSCDDVPLARIAARAGVVDLIDFDASATARAIDRLAIDARRSITAVACDVTGGCADIVLTAVRDATALPQSLPHPYGPVGRGEYDLVVGDMLYTQLLHAGLIALDIVGDRQHELMARYDPPLVAALVQRIQSSVRLGGHAVHVHDVACWSSGHDQPLTIDRMLADPERGFTRLRRHDRCDPHLVLAQLRVPITSSRWWRWPFEPNKQFVVRASVVAV